MGNVFESAGTSPEPVPEWGSEPGDELVSMLPPPKEGHHYLFVTLTNGRAMVILRQNKNPEHDRFGRHYAG